MLGYRGLTWDHPRGRRALEAAVAVAAADGLDLRWDAQSLEGFEAAPIDELAQRYDLIVLDHPHLGDAWAADCLQPMEDVVGPGVLEDVGARAVGPSLESYRFEGATWALPLDAATQVSAARPDLVDSRPVDWQDVVALADIAPVALSLSGPHAYLTFASMCRSFGAPLATDHAARIVDSDIGAHVLELLATLAARVPAGSLIQNPIALLERMTSTDEIAYIPLVYGYVGYADQGRDRAVRFGAAPEGLDGVTGSTIGGAGIAVTRRCRLTPELRRHLVWLLSDSTQAGFIAEHEGQPSVRAAWESPTVNEPVGDFYRHTRATIESSWVRPRFEGFPLAQARLSAIVRDAVTSAAPAGETLSLLTETHNSAARIASARRAEGAPA